MTQGFGRRVAWTGPSTAVLEDFELAPLAEEQVRVQTEYSVVSPGTERAWLTGTSNTSQHYPQYPGYSAMGRIVEVGPGVDLRIGERALCYFGGHTSHATLPAERAFALTGYKIPDVEAAFATVAVIGLQGVRKGGVEIGESVLIFGAGPIGLFAVQSARLAGAVPVMVVDPDPLRRELALTLGADYALDSTDDLAERVQEKIHGRLPDVVIEGSGQPGPLLQAVQLTRRHGRTVLLGCTRDHTGSVDFYRDIQCRGITIIGAHERVRPDGDSSPGYWTFRDDFRTVLELYAHGRLQIAPLAGRVVPVSQAPQEYAALAARSAPSVPPTVVFDWTTV